MTILILLFLAAGFLCGRFVPAFSTLDFSSIQTIALYILLFAVGFDLMQNRSLFRIDRSLIKRVILLLCGSLFGILVGFLVCRVFFPYSAPELLALASGFGWYSLAPVILDSMGAAELSVLALFTNILREVLAFILIPLLAKRIGYAPVVSLAGATSMDTTLPVISSATDQQTALMSLVHGIVLSSLVPVLVPFFYGLV